MKSLNLLILVFAINLIPVKGQEIGEIWSCHTANNVNSKSITQIEKSAQTTYNTNLKVINIYVHIIRQSNGSGGLSTSEVNSTLNLLYSDYSFANIIFNEVGRDYINNSTFYGGIDNSNYSNLISTNSHSDAIDIYFLSPSDSYSRASGIPGTALAVGGAYVGTSVLSHETGHTLGLYHTHSGRGCGDYANCSENIDGSNCSTCGDLICDTPADPCLSGNVTTGCIYIGDSRYTPDVNNIMSYAPPSCLTHFSNGQIDRLHYMITNATLLQDIWIPINISGPSTICDQATYTVENLAAGATVQWSASNNCVSLISGQGTNSAVFYQRCSGSSVVQIQAQFSLNGTITNLSRSVSMCDFTFTGSDEIPIGGTEVYTVTPNISSCTYVWEIEKGSQNCTQVINGNINTITFHNRGLYDLSCMVINSSGDGIGEFYIQVIVDDAFFRLSPNPTSMGSVTIDMEDNDSEAQTLKSSVNTWGNVLTSTEENYQIQLWNSFGLVKAVQTNQKSYQLDLSGVSAGFYYVHVIKNGKTYRKQLIVSK